MSSTASTQKCGNPSCSHLSDNTTALQNCARCRKEAYCSKECQAAQWSTHKQTCRRPNYVIRFQVCPGHIKNPAVARVLSCPADATFYDLHLALQTAFGWATTHSFDFGVLDPEYSPSQDWDSMFQNMALGTDPNAPRQYLFRVFDPVKGSMFSGIDRMHEGPRKHPNTPEKSAKKYKLYQLLDDAKWQGQKLIYTYDFGDGWEHHLEIKSREDPTNDFVCLDGSGHPIAEDCGGAHGWQDIKAAYRASDPITAKQREKRKWFEREASNRDPRGLAGGRVNAFDKDKVNRDLLTMYERFNLMAEEAQRREAAMEARLRRR
ncbi:MM3350-like domain-containing protein [Xylaria acuta]|nr:MM3350-like domain-containing protein [Xylaria acuta]